MSEREPSASRDGKILTSNKHSQKIHKNINMPWSPAGKKKNISRLMNQVTNDAHPLASIIVYRARRRCPFTQHVDNLLPEHLDGGVKEQAVSTKWRPSLTTASNGFCLPNSKWTCADSQIAIYQSSLEAARKDPRIRP